MFDAIVVGGTVCGCGKYHGGSSDGNVNGCGVSIVHELDGLSCEGTVQRYVHTVGDVDGPAARGGNGEAGALDPVSFCGHDVITLGDGELENTVLDGDVVDGSILTGDRNLCTDSGDTTFLEGDGVLVRIDPHVHGCICGTCGE